MNWNITFKTLFGGTKNCCKKGMGIERWNHNAKLISTTTTPRGTTIEKYTEPIQKFNNKYQLTTAGSVESRVFRPAPGSKLDKKGVITVTTREKKFAPWYKALIKGKEKEKEISAEIQYNNNLINLDKNKFENFLKIV